jgi:acetyl-CoA carboxylase carboxyl transferase subunit alpha
MAKESSKFVLEFEKPVFELEEKIKQMKTYTQTNGVDMKEDIERLEKKAGELRSQIYENLSRWQRVQLARHPQRPFAMDYIEHITDYFEEIHGDRNFADDNAIVAGFARIGKYSTVIIGQQKGRDTKSNIKHNFGMMHPEGYRKALRLMKLAAKFNKPVITLIDTPGAYPGLGAEERGQAEAIAKNLFEMSHLPVPIICVIIGEGASGGALGIGVGDRLLMLENAWYSVISPEGCAAILWRDSAKASEAAEAMKVSAKDLVELDIIDEVIKEPEGGAHKDVAGTAELVKKSILKHLDSLNDLSSEKLINSRIEKFSNMGAWEE